MLGLGIAAWLVNLYDLSFEHDAIRHVGGLFVFLALRVGRPWQALGVALGAAAGDVQSQEPLYGPLLELLEVIFIGTVLRFRRDTTLRTLDALFWTAVFVPVMWEGMNAAATAQAASLVVGGLLCSQINIALSALVAASLPLRLVRWRKIRPVNVNTQEYIASWISVLFVLPLFGGLALFESQHAAQDEEMSALNRRAYSALGAANLEALQARYSARLAKHAAASEGAAVPTDARRVSAPGFTRIVSVAAHEAPPPTADVWVAALTAGDAPRILLGEVPLSLIRAHLTAEDAMGHWHIIRRDVTRPCVSSFSAATCTATGDLAASNIVVPAWSRALHVWMEVDEQSIHALDVSRKSMLEACMVLLWLLASLPGYAASRRVTRPLTRAFDALSEVSGGPPLPITNPNLLMLAPRIIARHVARLSSLMKRKQAQLDAVLKEQEAILAASPIVLFLFDLTPENRILPVRFSSSMEAIFGWTAADATVGEWWRHNVHPDDRYDELVVYGELRRKEKTAGQFRFRCKNGIYRHVQGELSILERHADGTRRVVGVWVDITDYTRAMKRADTNERLLSLATLAAGLAHELKQPLNVIAMAVGNARRALERTTPDSTSYALEKLDRVAEQVQRASTLIDEMRPGRLGTGLQARPDGRDARQTLRRVVNYFEDELKSLDIRIEFISTTWPMLVEVEGAALEQVLANLIANARDAILEARRWRISPQDDIIQVSIEKSPTSAPRIVVTDTGTGFDEQLAARLFEPFYSTKDEGDGRGLGLFTVANLVRDMHGTIHAANTGSGARFTVELPDFARQMEGNASG